MKHMPCPELDEWKEKYLANQAAKENELAKIANPMVRDFGLGPWARRCKECKHLVARRFSKTYYKCTFRKETRGPASDHRVGWDACAKFEAREEIKNDHHV